MTEEEHFDDYAVRQFAKLMAEKMAISRAKGRYGWQDPSICSVEALRTMLYEHLDKGDPVDVANICMMLRHYGASTTREYGNSQSRIAELTALLAARATPQVRAKPLKFFDEDGDGVLTCRDAGKLRRIIPQSRGNFYAQEYYPTYFPTAEAAIAAYQADHDANILSCIEIVPGNDRTPWENLIVSAIAEADKAMRKFPQPNYVISKIAEEAGEVVKAAIHCAENRETAENVRGEMKQLIAMLYRLWVEGDQVHGLPPVMPAEGGK